MTEHTRRSLLGAAAALPMLGSTARAAAGDTKLIILGTLGGPAVGAARYNTSHVLLHAGAAYVVDCGYGVTEQLVRAGVKLPSVRDVFVTHHHPDHNIELGTLIYFAWYYGRSEPLGIYGPPPIGHMTRAYLDAQKPDVDIWVKDIDHKPMPPVTTHEISHGGPVMHDENVRVTAAIVQHPPVTPALGYRFDFPGRSIAFSGDTAPSEAVVQLAKGADVLVHEAIYLEALPGGGFKPLPRATGSPDNASDPKKLLEHLIRSHSPAEEVGRIAAEAGVKTLVLSHLAPAPPTVPEETWRAEAAKHFKGEIIVARDLMVI